MELAAGRVATAQPAVARILSSNKGGGMPDFLGPEVDGPKVDGALGCGRVRGQTGGGTGQKGPDPKNLYIFVFYQEKSSKRPLSGKDNIVMAHA